METPDLDTDNVTLPTNNHKLQRKRSHPPEPSCVSMKSDGSMDLPLNFRNRDSSSVHSVVQKSGDRREKNIITATGHDPEPAAVNDFQKKFRLNLVKKFQCLNGVMINPENRTLLNEIYTELYITEGDSGDVNKEHEVRQIEAASRRTTTEETPIKCNDIFKPLSDQDKPIRTVLTKGVAGIGKTVSVQKFILDWAEGKVNQDVQLMFPLPFRELNLMKDQKLSLMDLLHVCFKETKETEMSSLEKVLFIFDGLDECRFPLDFQNTERVCDVTESASVHVLLINLIKGNLLPSALIWITSRPAAADQIPSECVHRVTEVRGFNDPQKEEYFRKRISDQSLANNIITHLKSLRSLYIMCHIPVFCWISATVLERMLDEAESGEMPKTLTQMYTHFLIIQTNIIREKYSKKQESDEEMLLKLGRLAFQQLMKGNLIFYEEDLRECGIDVREAAVYSGVCTQIFREEFGLHQSKVYSFVHLSTQEHLAALYVHLTFMKKKRNVLKRSWFFKTISDVHKSAVRQALKSETGHLDLFLRFLLGLSLESNQKLLHGLVTHTGSSSQTGKGDTVQYIKEKISRDTPTEKSINLFHCLNELGDNSLVEEIQLYLKSGTQSGLSSSQWSALVFVLLTSAEELEEFDLSKYISTDKIRDEILVKVMPVIAASRRAIIRCDTIQNSGWRALDSVLSSETSNLRELHLTVDTLDLIKNKLGDSEVKRLSALLENPQCKVKNLRLGYCDISGEGCAALTSALRSNPSHLRELDLSDNKLGDSGLKSLSAVLENPLCKLEILWLWRCDISDEGCAALTSALRSNPSHLKKLCLSENNLGVSGVKSLSAVLENPLCKLEILGLEDCRVSGEGCAALASALRSNPSHLRKLDLSKNKLGDSGVKSLSAGLENPLCKLEILWLRDCDISDEGCTALTSALRSNPSHLRKLDLSENKLGVSGAKSVSAVLENPLCKLEILCKLQRRRPDSPEPSCVSMMSDASMEPPGNFRNRDSSSVHSKLKRKRPDFLDLSCVSMKSDVSMDPPGNFRNRDSSSVHSVLQKSGGRREKNIITATGHDPEPAAVNDFQKKFKLNLVKKFQCLNGVMMNPENRTLLNEIYTELYITEGDSGDVNKEHEVRQIEAASRRTNTEETPIKCNDIFKPLSDQDEPIRTVLTKLLSKKDKPIRTVLKKLLSKKDKPIRTVLTKLLSKKDEPIRTVLTKLLSKKDEPIRTVLKKLLSKKDEPIRTVLKKLLSKKDEPIRTVLKKLLSKKDEPIRTVLTKLLSKKDEPIRTVLKKLLSKKDEPIRTVLKKLLSKKDEPIRTVLKKLLSKKDEPIRTVLKKLLSKKDEPIRTVLKKLLSKKDKPIRTVLKKLLSKKDKPIRTVLTKGVAGIGKTVSVQKFILDWAEGKVNQDVQLVFPLPFRELNLMKDQKLSLMDLLHVCFKETKETEMSSLEKVLFIFDGLDECRFPLDFQNTERVCDVTESASVHVLLINLIKGNLLPSALIWITSRPAAADQIPSECVHRVTEVRGFNDPQKEEYFRKRISDQSLANNIITHLKSLRSLYIMCHIPVFCWISATVLERMLDEAESGEMPKTLTQMYTHFLIIQTNIIREKYSKKQESDEEMLLKLGHLAFQQLMKGNLIFYEEDLRECGIDVREAAVYSGVCTQIFREEFGLHQSKVYSFVHLSIQEHLAALYVHLTFMKEKRNVLDSDEEGESEMFYDQWIEDITVSDVHKSAVDKALYSETGHLDLFLRFLLGLSLESNQKLLHALVTHTGSSSQTGKSNTVQYIKEKISEDPPTEKSINLFHCLNELGDNSLVEEIQRYLKSGTQSELSSSQWSALVFVLLTSAEELEEFDLSKYISTDKIRDWIVVKVMPVIAASRRAIIRCDTIQKSGWRALDSVLSSETSNLRELHLTVDTLHLTWCELGDSGVKRVSALLENPQCKVKNLKLRGCDISGEGCAALTSALRSNPSHLRELYLSDNNLGDSGVKSLSAVLENPLCKLEKLSKLQRKRSDAPEPSCVSMKSDASMVPPWSFRNRDSSPVHSKLQRKRSDAPEPSCVSMKSDASMVPPWSFRNRDSSPVHSKLQRKRSDAPEPSCVSMKSDASMVPPWSFRNKDSTSIHSVLQRSGDRREKNIITATGHDPEPAAVNDVQKKFKLNLVKKFLCLNGVMINPENRTPLNEIYTELYITEGDGGDVNKEHEVRQIEAASRRTTTEETPIKCNDIFKPLSDQDKPIRTVLTKTLSKKDKPIRTVLTKGVAGIGKTVSVQKFILDWAEGKVNQDVQLMFPLPFRELNLMKDQKLSLMDLLHVCFKETKETEMSSLEKVLFIFDGLDECRFPLDFQNTERVCDVTESASVHVLLINLIKGNLLPSALIWITSRPAAADQIPSECVHRVTELRGFNDPQKEEYFRKRISDQSLANNIITHLKSLRSLYIMCHIPVFCWISATVLERMLDEAESGEMPKTLTQMYTHFLIIQTNIIREKYSEKHESDEEMLLKLGRLAFQQLMKGNLIFYEEDLRECGIDVREAAVYSGVCTQIFREEFGLHQSKVYCFVHLSIQEHLAALYVHLTFMKEKRNVLEQSRFFKTISDVHEIAVHQALKSETGHLDLFLRFLLGLSLESNQKLLHALVTHTGSISRTGKSNTVQYIKEKISEDPPTEKSINLFHCLNELGDNSLVEEIQRYLKSGTQSELSSSQWSALVFVLLTSAEELEEFDLSKYISTDKIRDEILVKVMPVIAASRKAIIRCDTIQKSGWRTLDSVLSSETSNLRELHLTMDTLDLTVDTLDLTGNKLGDSGVKRVSALLENPQCKVKNLRLECCGVSGEGCAALASALRSNPSHLRELNLSDNKLGDSGVKSLSAVLENPLCKLEILGLYKCGISDEGCAALTSALRSNPSHLRELDLSWNKLGDSGVKSLSAVLENPLCKLEKLWLYNCGISDEGCAALTSALRSNPSHLRDLTLCRHNLGVSGVKSLSAVLEDPLCKLEILRLRYCDISGEGCAALALALRSNPSHLRELYLAVNNLGDSGVKSLSAVLENPLCKLEKLELSECRVSDEGCAALASALRSNPSHLRELNLAGNNLGYSGVKSLSALKNDERYKLHRLELHTSLF
ncbi:uncharacterized protein LOC108272815 isoform X26 [Ictalurus punctatus]|uniref:Uncharacterized protein LOC108272815 isoform X26 n=1 Tax=Ictalurus punctatus TaxID=7998 RepID=A0A9F7R8V2_ICTPU|nr:uncharacterized protein LOC108272815 isoform X26 [Ictalurus punctatus]